MLRRLPDVWNASARAVAVQPGGGMLANATEDVGEPGESIDVIENGAVTYQR